MPPTQYVRFRSIELNAFGVRVGVFALCNGLARSGALTDEEHQRWRESNDWFEAAYPEPSKASPGVYDRSVNPGAVAWFKDTAVELIERMAVYVELLDAHSVLWEKIVSDSPGRIVYEDDVHVVAVPEMSTENGHPQ